MANNSSGPARRHAVKALVVGGTGPTGPFLVQGLLQRGYEVAILHRGTHETAQIPPEVEHIHADPHFLETLQEALAGRWFDLVIATYGRLRFVAEALAGKTARFIGIGGTPGYRGLLAPQANFPTGLPVPTSEDAAQVQSEAESRFAYLIVQTERTIMQQHHDGHFSATMLRYPVVYGPNHLSGAVWPVMRRILDRRPHIILPDGGLTLLTRGYAPNMAHAVLLAADQPDVSAGQIYNCGDERYLTLRQWVEIIAHTMEYDWDIVCLPDAMAHPARCLIPLHGTSSHQVMDLTKIKTELGYKDLVPVTEALPLTVRWYRDHLPDPDSTPEGRGRDPLNYEAEDALVALHNDYMQRLRSVPFEIPEVYHTYAHPKVPGLQRDHRRR
jgi:nucleoside-diphosphate-sugar epimerase